MLTKDIIQLPLLNGTIVCFPKSRVEKFYCVREETKLVWCLKSSFPWISLKHKRYTTFRVQDVFSSMTCSDDSYYEVNLTLNTFLDLFGISYKSADESILNDTINYG